MPEDESAGEGREPAWPSADHDGSGERGDELTSELPVPKVTPDEPATVWVTRPETESESGAGDTGQPEWPVEQPQWPGADREADSGEPREKPTQLREAPTQRPEEPTRLREAQTRAGGEGQTLPVRVPPPAQQGAPQGWQPQEAANDALPALNAPNDALRTPNAPNASFTAPNAPNASFGAQGQPQQGAPRQGHSQHGQPGRPGPGQQAQQGQPQYSQQQAQPGQAQPPRSPQQVQQGQSSQPPQGQQGRPPQGWQGQRPAPAQGGDMQARRGPPQPGPVPEIRPASGQARPMRIEPGGELRPAAATTGDQDTRPAQQEGEQAQPPAESEPPTQRAEPANTPQGPRRRTRLVVGGVAVLLVVAIGVVLALPPVSNRLGLPWGPNAPTGEPPEPVAVTRQLHGPDGAAPAPTPSGVAAQLSGPVASGDLGTLTGSVLDPASGTTLWEQGAGETRTPASTTKLLTSAAALLSLDHTMRIPTKVVQGEQPGTVVLVAGGDVTLNSLPAGQDSIYPGSPHLDELVQQVKQAAGDVREVRLDLSVFTGDRTAAGWAPEDAPSTFAAPVQPVMLDGGRSSATVENSKRVDDPAGVLGQQLAQRLGATVGGQATAPADAKVLGQVGSAPLSELVDQALTQSDNLLADVLGRQVAMKTGAEPSFAGAAKATLDVLREHGFDVAGASLSDNSGLSTENKVSAKLLSQVLAVAAAPEGKDPRTAKLRPMLGGLPVAGGSGTLADRFTEPPAEQGKGWTRAKTGTLSEVNTLAGVVLDTDGRLLVFTLMSGGSGAYTARPALDAVVAALRGCGCR